MHRSKSTPHIEKKQPLPGLQVPKRPASPERKVKLAARFAALTNSSKADRKPRTDVSQLSLKQREFIKLIGGGESGYNAAVLVGVSPSSASSQASRWRKDPLIMQLIDEEQKKYALTCQMTKEKVMNMHMEAYNMSKLMSEPATMVSAAREIGKLCGYYEPVKYQLDVNLSGQVALERLNTLSDAELLKLIAEGAPKGSVGALLPPPQASQTAN